jgi:ribonuclease HI
MTTIPEHPHQASTEQIHDDTTSRKTVVVYTDGACSGNPGPGGWAAILQYHGRTLELSGGEAHTTNNRMELFGAIAALRALKQPCDVIITTDSTYLHHAFSKGWLAGWQRKNWRTASGEPVKNQDLWQDLLALSTIHNISWQWQRGHVGHEFNARDAARNRRA